MTVARLDQVVEDAFASDCGIVPIGFYVVFKPDKVKEKTDKGLYLPKTTQEADQLAKTEGELVAIGAAAFDYFEGRPKPKAGDRVIVKLYAGITVKGKDGDDLWLVKDDECLAIMGK